MNTVELYGTLGPRRLGLRRINHLVLRVRDLDRSVDFYRRVFGLSEAVERFGPTMAFLRLPGSTNHHDLGLLEVGPDAAPTVAASVGLLHFALEVDDLPGLVEARRRLVAEGCFDREFDHGATRSVYGWDPDGNNVEVVWVLPRADWGEWDTRAPDRMPLDLEADLARWG